MQSDAGIVKETAHWHATYGDVTARERRRAAMPVKLRKLGADRVPTDAAVLDMCCGNGEALEALYAMGYRNLHGLDITLPDELRSDGRFTVTSGNALTTPLERRFDWIIIVHAMHHFETADNAIALIDRCSGLLAPGGRLSILDFPDSPQIRAAFWFFRQRPLLLTPYLRNFGTLIQEEWPFLQHYLPQFRQIWSRLHSGDLEIEIERNELFYFYLTLRRSGAHV